MAFDDFIQGIPAPLAQEIDALSLLVYRCRTAAKKRCWKPKGLSNLPNGMRAFPSSNLLWRMRDGNVTSARLS